MNSCLCSCNKISWYLKRLSCMSCREMAHRLFRYIVLNVNRFFQKDADLGRILKRDNRPDSVFYFDAHRPEEVRNEFSGLFKSRTEEIADNADKLCQHNFRILSRDWDAASAIDWHMDILSGKRWPLKYFMDIDYRNDNRYPEARYIWELNRHQHFITFGKAYFLTGEESYAEEIIEEISSWIEQNPAYKGINWTSPLESALRLISWCWAYRFIEGSSLLTQGFREVFLKYVYLQADFIRNNMSLYSSANNHLIGESCALVITGLTFQEFKDSKAWVKKGQDILFKEINKQVYEDGVIKEQAFHYQGFIMELLMLAIVLLRKNNKDVPGPVIERFMKMSEFLMDIIDSGGNVPNIGDSDNGMAIKLSGDEGLNIYKSILCSAAILSGRGDFKNSSGGFLEEHYWLFGFQGFETYSCIKQEKRQPRSSLYKEGGYAILRNGDDNGREKLMVMDCGQLGYLSIAAHGHNDLFSITLSAYGTQLLIDPGTYLYHRGGEWRSYFRGAAAHNTVEVSNGAFLNPEGPFMWGKERPCPRICAWESSDRVDRISASYSNSNVFHKRSILFDKEKEIWIVEDAVDVSKRCSINQYFHLAPASIVKRLDKNIIEAYKNGVFLYIMVDPYFSIKIKEGQESPISGWSSNMFGEKVASPTIINSAFIERSAAFRTLLHVSKQALDGSMFEQLNIMADTGLSQNNLTL